MNRNSKLLRRAVWALVAAALIGGFAFVVVRSQAMPEGPRPVVWDREACAECRMTVSDPRFACQLQTTDGQVLDFDDPGCLFHYMAEHDPAVRALYFRASDEDRWLARDEVAFVAGPHSPMGYDLAAVPAGHPSTMDFAAARTRALTRESFHDAP